jgi:site-specific DNA-methyltransferase (adenine-specific)
MNVTSKQEWNVSKQTIICNDCVVEMKSMPEKSVDVIVTSPPYNIGIKYKTYQDRMTNEAYLAWLCNVGLEIKRILKDDGSLFLNIGNKPSLPYIAMQVCMEMAKNTGLILQNNIVWVKSITINNTSSGHFKPINSKRYLNDQHESIFHFTKTGLVTMDRLGAGVPYADKSNIERWHHGEKGGKPDLRCRGNTWFIPYKTVQKKKEHPAGFPTELPEMCIKLAGIKNDMVVLDPFLGCGSSLLACNKLNLNGIGIELDETYCQMTLERLKNETIEK